MFIKLSRLDILSDSAIIIYNLLILTLIFEKYVLIKIFFIFVINHDYIVIYYIIIINYI